MECPILLFVSNGKQIDKNWVKCQREFAASMNAQLICFDCVTIYIITKAMK